MSRMHGSHWDWKTWKNRKPFSSQGIFNKILEKSDIFVLEKSVLLYWKMEINWKIRQIVSQEKLKLFKWNCTIL